MEKRNQIMQEITKLAHYKKVCRNIARQDLADDLYQEFLLALLTYPGLEDVYAKEWFNYFCIRIITNLYNSETSAFYLKYRQNDKLVKYRAHVKPVEVAEMNAFEEDELLNCVIEELEKLDWYDKELFKQYAKTRSSVSLAHRTRISQREILETVARVKETIKNSQGYQTYKQRLQL